MTETANLRNPEMFNNFQLYTRCIYNDNYDVLVKTINRQPNIRYPKGWYDYDIDRLILGKYCVHHGIQELKRIDNLDDSTPYKFSKAHRESIKKYLTGDHFNIENSTKNYSYIDRCGVWKDKELNINPVEYDYSEYLLDLNRAKEANGTTGKGVFLYVIYTDNLEFFSVINFTNSKYILGEKRLNKGGNDIKIHLERVANVIEPCFNELLLFMLEAYVRGDFKTLYKYISLGVGADVIKLSKKEKVLKSLFIELERNVPLWLALKDTMEWLMKCIHFDNILEEAVKRKTFYKRPSYSEFVKLVQDESIFNHLAEMIREQFEYYSSGYDEDKFLFMTN